MSVLKPKEKDTGIDNAVEQRRTIPQVTRKRSVLLFFTIFLALVSAAYLYFGRGSTAGVDGSSPFADGKTEKSQGTIHIALITSLRGPQSPLGESLQRGAQHAAQLINADGGILEQVIKLHILDTRSEPQLARELTNDLAQKVPLSLIIGALDEETVHVTAEVAEEFKVPYLYFGNGRMRTCKPDKRLETLDYVWGLGLSRQMIIEPFFIFLADKTERPEASLRVFFFSGDNLPDRENADFSITVSESLLFETAGEDYLDDRIQDYFQRVRAIFPTRPNVLFLSFSPRVLNRMVPQLSKLGVRAEMTVATISGLEEEFLTGLGTDLDGYVTISRYISELDSVENKKFLETWQTSFGKEIIPTETAVVGGYSSLMIAKAAFEKAGSLDFQRFREAMKNLEVSLPQGKVMVSAINNLVVQPLYAVKVKQERHTLAEYLGDVSHPGMEACSTPQAVDQLPEDQAPTE